MMVCYTSREISLTTISISSIPRLSLKVFKSERRSRAVDLHQHSLSEALPDASPMPPERGRWSWQRVAQGAWIGLLVSILLVLFGSTGFLGFNLPTQTPPLFQVLAQIITYGLMWPAMLVFFFTFPTGRFTPRWTLAAFVPFFVVTMLSSLLITTSLVPGLA